MSATPVLGAILAGGRASRMGGRPKGLELLDGRRLVDHVRDALAAVTGEVVVLGGDPAVADSLGARWIADEVPAEGPLGAIVSGLRATGADLLVVAWDMPRVTPEVLRPLLAAPPEADVVVWRLRRGIEPLVALYRQRGSGALSACFAQGERRARAGAMGPCIELDGSALPPEVFSNINTEEELRIARGDFRLSAPSVT